MKASEVLSSARDILNTGWHKGWFSDGKGNYCAIGACMKAAEVGLMTPEVFQKLPRKSGYRGATAALSDKLFEMTGEGELSEYNDDPKVTKQDMLDLFDKTIAGLEEKGL